ncbi:MAG TPA: hypothetical protein DCL43_06105 [Chitinophagaceae bacterium]|nr:hypothetical protein [Chitinophagaceae bacterium]HAN39803.1 hypothetical protein [Chitinophagaceae bacterium]
MIPAKNTVRSWSDIIAMLASLACAIHCVALPLLFSTVPFLGIKILENIWLELATIIVSITIGGIAMYKGVTQYHRQKWVVILFISGISSMLLGNMISNEVTEPWLKHIGAMALIIAHVYNYKKSKHCHICNQPKSTTDDSL